MANILGLFIPVGSTYYNKTNSTNPATLLGFGTWAALENVVLGGRNATSGTFNVNGGTTVGAETTTLTSAQSGVPAHTHPITFNRAGPGGGSTLYYWTETGLSNTAGSNQTSMSAVANSAANAASSHSNVQQTLVGYLWERTA